MKAVLIFHNAALNVEVNRAMADVGVEQYSRFPGTLGKGALSEPHLDTDVWPQVNSGTMVITDQGRAQALMDRVRQMRKESFGTEGIKAFMWNIDDMTE